MPRSSPWTAPPAGSSLTIKGKEIEEEREAMKEFGSTDSGASLGDILGAAIRRRREMAGEE